ncbi:ABC transporter permease [Leifsonia sp. Root112D2]|uniref:ABC transporter permease n=1 Tax=Leifsonia sp. Root112D2 TaxID=1736426 RepID=UPI0006FA56E8|nr:ABC transporter permease subunit [Leifsonia sp. Root112D2]KQV07869.1 ABC transporter permease [Leifsonia sp. Root112D2]
MTWLWSNFDLVWQLTLDHVALSVPPIVVGFLLSLPIGWLANRRRGARRTLLPIGGILYAIPSLPLFVLMPSLIGTKILDPINVVIALSIYSLALMVRTSADALASVDPDVRQSSTAVGFSAWQRFWQVELPLAGPVLLAGVRVVSVSTVSLVSVGAVVGVNNLGYLFLNGFQRDFPEEIFIGIVASVLIALVFDLVLVGIGRVLMPWSRATARSRRRRQRAAAEAVSVS